MSLRRHIEAASNVIWNSTLRNRPSVECGASERPPPLQRTRRRRKAGASQNSRLGMISYRRARTNSSTRGGQALSTLWAETALRSPSHRATRRKPSKRAGNGPIYSSRIRCLTTSRPAITSACRNSGSAKRKRTPRLRSGWGPSEGRTRPGWWNCASRSWQRG